MKSHYWTLIAAVFAGFVGGAISTHIFGIRAVEAAGKKLAVDTITANHVIVSGDITVQTSSQQASNMLVLRNAAGDSFTISSSPGVGAIGIQVRNDKDPNPSLVLNTLGLAVLRQDPDMSRLAQFNPDGLKFTNTTPSSASTQTATLNPFMLTLGFVDPKPADWVTVAVSDNGISYDGHGKKARFPQ